MKKKGNINVQTENIFLSYRNWYRCNMDFYLKGRKYSLDVEIEIIDLQTLNKQKKDLKSFEIKNFDHILHFRVRTT